MCVCVHEFLFARKCAGVTLFMLLVCELLLRDMILLYFVARSALQMTAACHIPITNIHTHPHTEAHAHTHTDAGLPISMIVVVAFVVLFLAALDTRHTQRSALVSPS